MGKKSIKHAKTIADLPKPYFPPVMEEISKQTDRGAVIVASAFIELCLREAIESRLKPLPEVIPNLFAFHGPLSDFSARIDLAFVLGIFNRAAFNDLSAIREIRNAFAHSAEPITFDTESVAARCKQLWYPRKIHMQGQPDPITPREFFVRAFEWLVDGLFEETHRNAKNTVLPKPISLMRYDPPAPTPTSPRKQPKPRRSGRRNDKHTD